jgi:hypothetical protein
MKFLGLLGAKGYSSYGLKIATIFLTLFSRRYVPDVPFSDKRGLMPFRNPDFTLSSN